MKVQDIMQRDVATVSENERLSLALQIMLWRNLRHLPVMREGRIVGLLSERDLLVRSAETTGARADGVVGDVMSHPVETIHPYALVADAAALMSTKKIGCLPVIDAGALVGILTATDVLGASAWIPVAERKQNEATVESKMTTNLVAAHRDDTMIDAVALMTQRGVRHLPVIDGVNHVIGIVSERDIRAALLNPLGPPGNDEGGARRLADLRVSQVMTPEPRTIHADAPLSAAAQALVTERFGALPVVDSQEHLVGMLSYIDLLTAS